MGLDVIVVVVVVFDLGRYAKEVCDAIVAKCLTGRPKTVEKAQAAFLLWVELEATDVFLVIFFLFFFWAFFCFELKRIGCDLSILCWDCKLGLL